MESSSRADPGNSGDRVRVLFVKKRHAKQIKTTLERSGEINKDFRMVPGEGEWNEAIAIPVLEMKQEYRTLTGVVGDGSVFCPYSTSLLGNHTGRAAKTTKKGSDERITLVEQALLASVEKHGLLNKDSDGCTAALSTMREMDQSICPKKLEYLGDDKTLVLQRKAFSIEEQPFLDFLGCVGCRNKGPQQTFLSTLWESLASAYKSPRLVRRGEIAPSSGMRESSYRLLWPFEGVPEESGPGSPAWITVTEQGIRQSFDMTRVMFSRGNITEKIRFGQLVQKGDIVLDLYGGIGYFTLPALVHGEAEYVYACEWNPEAAKALRFNLSDNGVEERATVLEGDCRVQARNHSLVDMFDRVSLGLLPSSEGGWWTAVQAIRRSTGGWLHVHGNVPVNEIETWTVWMCLMLLDMTKRLDPAPPGPWTVICVHVERVKSFAPTVNHYVADVFLGNPETIGRNDLKSAGCAAAIIDDEGSIRVLDTAKPAPVPSCALSADGVLNHDWMRLEATDGG